ncbi:NusG domain II-containing protein [uncultured Oscillibacter sp.]|uniref:NusG domain II-containing protein n=1 Tax=uncultured Oscillibacter sp. TaxID=876091 RepID=UPI0025E1A05B|nr:NusG domain II-containing protein [uncultured Oscillibacter sp.]
MKPSPELRPTAWDGLVVLCVAALAIGLAVFQWRGGGQEDLTAAVSVDGVEIDRVSLERAAGERTYQAGDYALTVEYAAGSARVLASGCPTQDCVHTGAVTRGGQSIVCLPARFILRLEGGAAEDGGVDAVLG